MRWARTPGHDAYWDYRGPFFALLPSAHGRVLEVGCGEGRVCRDLAARGYRVVGLDASPTLVGAATERDPTGENVVGEAEALPFPDAAFQLVIAYNALMDVQDMLLDERHACCTGAGTCAPASLTRSRTPEPGRAMPRTPGL